MLKSNYNPDVLTCLANLSNDEVFTPPSLVNQILDLLPVGLWSDPDARFLDPVCKSGGVSQGDCEAVDCGFRACVSRFAGTG